MDDILLLWNSIIRAGSQKKISKLKRKKLTTTDNCRRVTMLFPFLVAFFLSVDLLRFQHAPTIIVSAVIFADILVLCTDMWEVLVVWKTLRFLSLLEFVWHALKWFAMYVQNW
jgi:hypothetical protein